jgi:transcriptional regulator with XRE-family HTH domain/tetratricopeptide (TPR) repeat protein
MTGTTGEQSFGTLLREARRRAGLTQEDLAARSGLSARSISDLERGRTRQPYFRSVTLLADALGVADPVRVSLQEAARGGVHRAAPTVPTGTGHDEASPPISARGGNGAVLALPRHGAVDGPGAGPDAWPASAVPQQLPASVADFTGRGREIRSMTAALSAPRGQSAGVMAVVICGQPGVGKTTLAVRVAHLLRPRFPDGQLWVDLAGASARPREPGEALGELLRAVGVTGSAVPGGEAERAALFRSWLADRRVLLLADDAGSSAQVRPLVPGTSASALLVTSRTQLTGLPGASLHVLDPFTPAEAMHLLTRMAGERRVAAEPEAAGELTDACGLVPLAVRISGARLAARPSWPVSLLVRKMAGQRRRLDELETEDLSVRVSASLSYDTLSEGARRAFRLLGLLGPQNVADWVVAALLGQPDAGTVVNELAGKSLLSSAGVDATGQDRYRLHDLLREYARERLSEEPQKVQDAALHRALTGWLQLARLAAQTIPCNPFLPADETQPGRVIQAELAEAVVADPLAWFSSERLNLLEAVRLAAAAGNLELAVQLAARQSDFQYLQDRTDEALQMWGEIVHDSIQPADGAIIAEARMRYAVALKDRGLTAEAVGLFERCKNVFEAVGNETGLAFALYWLASSEWDLGHVSAMLSYAQRGLTLAQKIGHRQVEMLNARSVGQALATLGQTAEGIESCERAVVLAKELGNESYELAAWHTLAIACVAAGDYDRAAKIAADLLKLSRRVANVRGEALAFGMLGDAYNGLGRYAEAAQALSAALSIFRDHANRRHYGLCMLKLGHAYQGMGNPQVAHRYLIRSLQTFQELRIPHQERRAREALSELDRGTRNGRRI